MDIVIEIQDFWDVDEKFIPKEVVVIVINATISDTGLWCHLVHLVIYPKELDEKTTGFRGIITALNGLTAKLISNSSTTHYNYAKLHGKHATYYLDQKVSGIHSQN